MILTSPKVRAVQTARLVGRAVGVTPQDEARLASAFELSDLGPVALRGREEKVRFYEVVAVRPGPSQ